MDIVPIMKTQEGVPDLIEIPAPTSWPIVFAFGVTLLFAGLVTSLAISALGAIVFIAGAAGWFREVLPHEKHESVRVSKETPRAATARSQVERVEIRGGLRRAWLPLEIYP